MTTIDFDRILQRIDDKIKELEQVEKEFKESIDELRKLLNEE